MQLQRKLLGKFLQHRLHDGPHIRATRPEESRLHTRVGLRHDDGARREEIKEISQLEHHVVINNSQLCGGERSTALAFVQLPASRADGKAELRVLPQGRARRERREWRIIGRRGR